MDFGEEALTHRTAFLNRTPLGYAGVAEEVVAAVNAAALLNILFQAD